MQAEKRKRKQKITTEQKEIYCSYMEQNPIIWQKKHSDASVQFCWQELALLLNGTGGVSHSVEEWKTVFDNWRYSVTHKLRQEKADLKKTGGGSPKKNDIEKLEVRAMACWGRIVVEGRKNVPVAGCFKFEGSTVQPSTSRGKQLYDPFTQLQENSSTAYNKRHVSDDSALELYDAIGAGDPKQTHKKRKTTAQNLDDDFIEVLNRTEANKQIQVDGVNNRLDKIISSIDSLTAAQMATASAIEKLEQVISKSNIKML